MAKSTNNYKVEVAMGTVTYNNANYSSLNTPNTNSGVYHTVKDITDLQLPTISKDNYEITTIGTESILVNDSEGRSPSDTGYVNTYSTQSVDGNRKYNGGLVDCGEITFTTEGYSSYPSIETYTNSIDSNGQRILTSAVLVGQVNNPIDLTTEMPFDVFNPNGNFISQSGRGGESNTGWADLSGDGGRIVTAGNADLQQQSYKFEPSVDNNLPTYMRNATDWSDRILQDRLNTVSYRLFTVDSEVTDLITEYKGSGAIKLPKGANQAHKALYVNSNKTVSIFYITQSSQSAGQGDLIIADLKYYRHFTWEEMCSQDKTCFFKVSDGSTQRMTFEARITNVETNAPIDGNITKTITAKLSGGITHG